MIYENTIYQCSQTFAKDMHILLDHITEQEEIYIANEDLDDDEIMDTAEQGHNLKLKVAYNDLKLLAIKKKEIGKLKKN